MKATREFIKELRSCQSIVFRFDGSLTIELSRLERTERGVVRSALFERLTTYKDTSTAGVKGTWVMLYTHVNDELKSIFSNIRINDELTFSVRDNGSPWHKDNNLICHDLILNIARPKKESNVYVKYLTFLLDYQVCASDSIAKNMSSI